jgi:hypothetical protein
MFLLPPAIRDLYRTATTTEIRSWSFGALCSVRIPNATLWEDVRGTLNDQSIFGPVQSYACACGKFSGSVHRGMICDQCGVKVASAEVRRLRFGHLNLTALAPHPFERNGETIQSFPVLPAAFLESARGGNLANLYEDVFRANESKQNRQLASLLRKIGEMIVPIFVEALDWNLQEAGLLGRGLALVADAKENFCDACGYPLDGVTGDNCSGCGTEIERQ